MDARAYYLMLYQVAHGQASGVARRILTQPTPEQLRVKLPGHNSLAWIIWHLAREEDWAVNTMLRGEEQVLTRDGWEARLGVARRDIGTGMTEEEVADLSARIDVGALRGYFDAVTAATLRFVDTFDFDALDAPLDVPAHLALAPEVTAPFSDATRSAMARQTTGRWFLNHLTLGAVYGHIGEADHVFQMIAAEPQS